MTYEFHDLHNFAMPPQPPAQQASRYTTTSAATASTTSTPRPRSTKPDQNVQTSHFMAPSHHVQGIAPGPLAQSTQTPGDPLEQRILDLLYPYRDECFDPEADVSAEQERMALVLCGMLQFF